jgi:putative AlgH/UPF0301 family transcriptional regulator
MNMKKYVGNLLIANPTNPDDELSRSVLICLTHTENVGIGLQINRIHTDTNLGIVANNLGIIGCTDEPLWVGGDTAADKVHIVHSLDWRGLGTVPLTKHIGVTQDISILAAISQGLGPRYFKACTGYWMFEDGVLDLQLSKKTNPENPVKWETLPATIETVFLTDPEILWETCLQNSIITRVKEYF